MDTYNVASPSSKKHKQKKITLIVFIIVVCVLIIGLLIIASKYTAFKSIPSSQTVKRQEAASPQALSPEDKEMVTELQKAYTSASTSAQGTITEINADKNELTITQILNGKKTDKKILITPSTILYERSFSTITPIKKLTTQELSINRFISVSGTVLQNSITAQVIAVDPTVSSEELPEKNK